MNIKDLDLSGYTIKTPEEYKLFKKDFQVNFPEISFNYSDAMSSLVGFIVALEKTYKENPEIEKVSFLENKTNDMHDVLFHIVDSNTNKELKGKGAEELSKIIVMHYYKALEGMDDEFFYDISQSIIETYHLDRLNEAPKEERFNIYKEMMNYSFSEIPESAEKIIDALEQGKAISNETKKVSLLGFDIDMETINIKNGIFKLDCSERDVKKVRTAIEDMESSYAISLVTDVIRQNNLDLSGNISLLFTPEKMFEYRKYKVEAEDENGTKAEINLDLYFGAVLPHEKKTFRGSILDQQLEIYFSKMSRYSETKERMLIDRKQREDNYTDVSSLLPSSQRRLKMK